MGCLFLSHMATPRGAHPCRTHRRWAGGVSPEDSGKDPAQTSMETGGRAETAAVVYSTGSRSPEGHTQDSEQWGLWRPPRGSAGEEWHQLGVYGGLLGGEGAEGRHGCWEPFAVVQTRQARSVPNLWQWDG